MDAPGAFPVDETVWRRIPGGQFFECLVCKSQHHPAQAKKKHIEQHENSAIHRTNAQKLRYPRAYSTTGHTQPIPDNIAQPVIESAAIALVHSIAHPHQPPPSMTDHIPWFQPEDFHMDPTAEEHEVAMSREIARDVLEVLFNDSSDDLGGDQSGSESSEDEGGEDELPQVLPGDTSARRKRRLEELFGEDEDWFPWPDKITCALDALMHLPRSVFSEKQLDLFLWLLRVLDVRGVPSVRSMKTFCDNMQKLYGVESIVNQGALGHRFYVNNLSQIISQEMSNPAVRPHLSFYPEDAGQQLSEARQGARWLHELPHELTTPSASIGGQTYFTFEPALLTNGRLAIPVRWFTRQNRLFAHCWKMQVVQTYDGPVWQAVISPTHIVCASEFLRPYPDLQEDMLARPDAYNVPLASQLHSIYDPELAACWRWTYSTKEGNPWRVRGKGARVMAFPIWLYCDDTSGNLSKKWNAHNSFLFTPAGLPRSESQKEYNVHFLCTSNKATPLEMLDGIVNQIEDAQLNGIWAWDCHLNEAVLLFPVVLALLGDNPMQSELSSHIGLRGRLFCRACWVERGRSIFGARPTSGDEDSDGEDTDDDRSVASDVGSEDGTLTPPASPSLSASNLGSRNRASTPTASSVPAAPTPPARKRRRKAVVETVDTIAQAIRNFIRPGRPRVKEETRTKLRSYFEEAKVVGTKTDIGKEQTKTGIKDRFQLHFLEQLFDSYKSHRGKAKATALKQKINTLPQNPDDMINPVWRIQGLDAHSDTPVEILHVVLLGFVKYFWRDVIKNQLKNNAAKKDLLAVRLTCLNVSGLGLSPLAGQTLVQYAGSLVGRDFRAIAQVAPFVLQDLVTPECFETWKALSRLVPLLWQPRIEHLEDYLTSLCHEIEQFLLRAARWTAAWFNKPKFHILVHLPDHIRRFGPAILFATEQFESFNAVIRAKSIHSNRQAPSRDIAKGFAQSNRVRHWLSGGYIQRLNAESVRLVPKHDGSGQTRTLQRPAFSSDPKQWATPGPCPPALVEPPLTSYLGLERPVPRQRCVRDKSQKHPLPYSSLRMARPYPQDGSHANAGEYWRIARCVLHNGDSCQLNDFVLVAGASVSGTHIARVDEMVQQRISTTDNPDYLFLQLYQLHPTPSSFGMPYMIATGQWVKARFFEVLCTVNTQHACSELKCGPTGQAHVYQERHLTSHTRPVIMHKQPVDRLVLNTGQMRDAWLVQPFRAPAVALNPEEEVRQSAEAMHAARRKQARETSATQSITANEGPTGTPPSASTAAPLATQLTTMRPPVPHRLNALRRS